MDLQKQRASRWWLDKQKIKNIPRAAAFIDDVGFAVLWPKKDLPLPSLWSIGTDGSAHDGDEGGWGPDAERLWGWKDELPKRKLAWYGPFVRGRKSFLSLSLLADLYPRAGKPDDFEDLELSPVARRIAKSILIDGPMAAALLREVTGLIGKSGGPQFTKAVTELGRALVITHFGVEEQDAGWPSSMFELTARAFKPKPKGSLEQRRARAATRFLDTMITGSPSELARAFNWSSQDARAALDSLVDSNKARAEKQGHWNVYRLT